MEKRHTSRKAKKIGATIIATLLAISFLAGMFYLSDEARAVDAAARWITHQSTVQAGKRG